MAFGNIQSRSASGTGTSITVSLTPSAKAGSLLVCGAFGNNTTAALLGITDNASPANPYTIHIGPIDNVGRAYMASAIVRYSGPTSVTSAWSIASGTHGICVNEFSGGSIDPNNFVGVTGSGTGTGAAGAVGTITPTPGNLVVAHLAAENVATGAFTAGTNYVIGGQTANRASNEYRLSCTNSETCPITWVSSLNWAEVAVEFKISPGTALQAGAMGFRR